MIKPKRDYTKDLNRAKISTTQLTNTLKKT